MTNTKIFTLIILFIFAFSVIGAYAQVPTPTPKEYQNIAIEKPAFASNTYSANYSAANAVDNSTATAWGTLSEAKDQWLYVDLGVTTEIHGIGVKWHNVYYGTGYEIYTSDDLKSFTKIITVVNGLGGYEIYPSSKNCRYVAILCKTSINIAYGINEFEIYQRIVQPTPTATPIPTPDDNLIKNGNFDLGIDNWYTYVDAATFSAATFDFSSYEMMAQVLNPGWNAWDIGVVQPDLTLTKGTSYTLTFDAIADLSRDITAGCGMSVDPYTTYGSDIFAITTDAYNTYSVNFVMEATTDATAQLFFNFGTHTNPNDITSMYIDNVSLLETPVQ